MPRFEIPLGDVREEKVAPEGMYDLRVFDAKEIDCSPEDMKDPDKNPRIAVSVAVESMPGVTPVNHTLWMPKPSQEISRQERSMRGIKRFFHAFDVPYDADGFTTEDLVGATGHLRLKQGSYKSKDGDHVPQNTLVLPRIKEEEDDD